MTRNTITSIRLKYGTVAVKRRFQKTKHLNQLEHPDDEKDYN